MRAGLFWVAMQAWACSAIADQPTPVTTGPRTAEAYTRPYASVVEPGSLKTFQDGRTLFRQVWTVEGDNQRFTGLGPLYNRFSCVACHPGNGRGFAPDGPAHTMKTMLVRLSVPDQQQGAVPHPIYGDQFNEFGIPGVQAEGIAHIQYQTITVTLADGEQVSLRQPQLSFTELAYGPLENVLTSARIAPAAFGLGLLDDISDAEILRLAQRRKPTGIAGRPNQVWDIAQQKMVIGKFGWKANVPNLRQQIASAFNGDLGITSSLYPQPNCGAGQTVCLAQTHLSPELSEPQLDEILFYLKTLAIPAPAPRTAETNHGAHLFRQLQCIACHSDQLHIPQLQAKGIYAYTDLLLHDMGDGLADHRPDMQANGREWRTPPLWGIGLAQTVHPQAGFLHDGRATTLLTAILWHGGEAEAAKQAVLKLSTADRAALLKFLESL